MSWSCGSWMSRSRGSGRRSAGKVRMPGTLGGHQVWRRLTASSSWAAFNRHAFGEQRLARGTLFRWSSPRNIQASSSW